MLKQHRIIFFLLIITLFWSGSCNFIEQPDREAVITIGNKRISREEARKEIDRIIFDMGITEKDAKADITAIINKIVEKKLILEYGKKNKITISEDELESEINALQKDYPEDVFKEMLLKRYIDFNEWKNSLSEELLIKKIVNTIIGNSGSVTFEETKNYYEKHKEEFRHPRMVQVRQIVTKTKEDMEKILVLIKNGSRISELAKDYSTAPEAVNGGMLGWISDGELEETISNVIFSLKKDELSKIQESPYGFHLFKVIDIKEEGIKEFPDAVREIESKISSEKKEIMFKKWLDGLKKEFPVSIKENQILADMDMEE